MGLDLWLWLAVIVVFVVLEVATEQLVSVWFIIGSVAAFVAALFNLSALWQIVIFFVVSAASLLALRPFLKSRIIPKNTPTNSDRLIGMVAVVKETVNNQEGVGRVTVDGSDWAARSYDGEIIEPGEKAVVQSIDGVKLIIQKIGG